MRIRHYFPLTLTIAAVAVVFNANQVEAARFISAKISVDGKPVLFGYTSDNGQSNRGAVWALIDSIDFRSEKLKPLRPRQKASSSRAVADDGLDKLPASDALTFRGDVRVEINFGGAVKLDELTLSKNTDRRGRSCWRLDSGFAAGNKDRRGLTDGEALKKRVLPPKQPLVPKKRVPQFAATMRDGFGKRIVLSAGDVCSVLHW